MNYKITPTEHPDIFTLEDSNGHKIAEVCGRENAEKFSMLPQFISYFRFREDVDYDDANDSPEYWRSREGIFEMLDVLKNLK